MINNVGHSIHNELAGFSVLSELKLIRELDSIIMIRDDFSISDYIKVKYGLPQIPLFKISSISACPIIINKVFFSSVDTTFLQELLLHKYPSNINCCKDYESFNIVFDIRTNRRKCLNQLEVIQKVVEYATQNLQKKINISIFGWYTTNGQGYSEVQINEQKQFVLSLKELFENDHNIQVYDYIGRELIECISICKTTDMILCNSGSGVGFLTNLLFNTVPIIHYTNSLAYECFYEQSIVLEKPGFQSYKIPKDSLKDHCLKDGIIDPNYSYTFEFNDFYISNFDGLLQIVGNILQLHKDQFLS